MPCDPPFISHHHHHRTGGYKCRGGMFAGPQPLAPHPPPRTALPRGWGWGAPTELQPPILWPQGNGLGPRAVHTSFCAVVGPVVRRRPAPRPSSSGWVWPMHCPPYPTPPSIAKHNPLRPQQRCAAVRGGGPLPALRLVPALLSIQLLHGPGNRDFACGSNALGPP